MDWTSCRCHACLHGESHFSLRGICRVQFHALPDIIPCNGIRHSGRTGEETSDVSHETVLLPSSMVERKVRLLSMEVFRSLLISILDFNILGNFGSCAGLVFISTLLSIFLSLLLHCE